MKREEVRDALLAQATPEQAAVIEKRDRFVYCASKGWNMDDLSFEQIREIRAQKGWGATCEIEVKIS